MCSARTPAPAYSRGMVQPPNGANFAPRATCLACNGDNRASLRPVGSMGSLTASPHHSRPRFRHSTSANLPHRDPLPDGLACQLCQSRPSPRSASPLPHPRQRRPGRRPDRDRCDRCSPRGRQRLHRRLRRRCGGDGPCARREVLGRQDPDPSSSRQRPADPGGRRRNRLTNAGGSAQDRRHRHPAGRGAGRRRRPVGRRSPSARTSPRPSRRSRRVRCWVRTTMPRSAVATRNRTGSASSPC